jgi:hypothetical protein
VLTVNVAINIETATAISEGTIRYLSNDFEGYNWNELEISLTVNGGTSGVIQFNNVGVFTLIKILFVQFEG